MTENIQHIIQHGESQVVELKTSFSDEVIITLCAFCNARGGAVYVGVADNGEVKGITWGVKNPAFFCKLSHFFIPLQKF